MLQVNSDAFDLLTLFHKRKSISVVELCTLRGITAFDSERLPIDELLKDEIFSLLVDNRFVIPDRQTFPPDYFLSGLTDDESDATGYRITAVGEWYHEHRTDEAKEHRCTRFLSVLGSVTGCLALTIELVRLILDV